MKNTEPLINSIKPTANTTVFAKWSDDPVFSVTFDGQGSPDELPGITLTFYSGKITIENSFFPANIRSVEILNFAGGTDAVDIAKSTFRINPNAAAGEDNVILGLAVKEGHESDQIMLSDFKLKVWLSTRTTVTDANGYSIFSPSDKTIGIGLDDNYEVSVNLSGVAPINLSGTLTGLNLGSANFDFCAYWDIKAKLKTTRNVLVTVNPKGFGASNILVGLTDYRGKLVNNETVDFSMNTVTKFKFSDAVSGISQNYKLRFLGDVMGGGSISTQTATYTGKGKYFDIGGDASYMLCIPSDRSKIDLSSLTFH